MFQLKLIQFQDDPDVRNSLQADDTIIWKFKENYHFPFKKMGEMSFFLFVCLFLFFFSWRLITLQYCSGFCHTLTWISLGYTCISPSQSPLTSLSTPSLWVFPVYQVRALVSCIQPGLVICFTLDSIHVSMLFSWNIPPSPSPSESKRLFYKSVSFFFFSVLHIGLSLTSF